MNKQAVGVGLGGQGGAYAAGPGGNCVCSSCGATKAKAAGTACTAETCPSCGAAMQRAGLPGPAKTTKELMGMDAVPFNAGAQFGKAHEQDGARYLTIIASDTGPDRQSGHDPQTGQRWKAERVTPHFLDKMKKLAEAGSIELNSSHPSAVPLAFTVGVADVADLDPALVGPYDLFAPVFKIEPGSAEGNQLWEMARDGKRQREFSIGGHVNSAYVKHDNEVGGMVKFLDDGVVTHVAVCRPGEAAVPRTGLAGAMVKAMADAGLNWDKLADEADAEGAAKAYVNSSGDVEISSTDIREAEASAYEYPDSPDFMANLQAIRARKELPLLNALLLGTFDEIDRDDEVEDKRTAKLKAVNDHADATEALLTKAVTDEELRSIVDNAQGGMEMSIFGDKTDEERTELAKLLKVEATKLEDMTLVDVFGQLQKMDEAERTAFEKAFVPIPALPAGDLSAVMSGLMRIDEVSALFKLFAETLGVDALRKEIADLKAVQAPAPATAPSAEVAAVPAETAAEGVEESDKPKPEAGAEVSAETAEVAAATGGADDVRTVVQDEIKKAMGTQGLTSEDSGAQPTGQRAEVEKMLGDGMNPADVMTAAFKP